MWLRPWKSTQRHSEPFFFLMSNISTPYDNEIGQMKLVLRFFSMNFLRASCLDAKREYIELIRS